AAIIDDHTPTPRHALFTWPRLIRVCIVSLALWGGVMGVLFARYGWDATLTQMGWFFTKAALLTFGGAYAVLPYVYQGGVEQYQWLTASQMIDGLALGETTPGPLIMVVTFIGFVGGWVKQILGPDNLFWAGAVAATVVTYFTFLPSFVFIFLGAPLIETTHGNLKFTAPLTGITAAVVGVVLNLAVFFAWHVLWPEATEAVPFSGPFEWATLAFGIAAFIALFRFGVGIIPVIGACGVAGLMYSFSKPLIGT
ncbi:MAG: chromate transporter, partial [Betaproteobacteria bacterium]|nr:chromate transporter [Betaproteobacteria bacterium]